MMEQLKAIPGVTKGGSEVHQSRRQSIVDMMTVALSRHETSRSTSGPPSAVPGKTASRSPRKSRSRSRKAWTALTAWGKTAPSDPRFDQLGEQLESQLRRHVVFEDRVLVALSSELSEDERARLGRKILAAEEHAPTRPRPHVPKRPGAAVKAAAAGTAAPDRAKAKAGDRPGQRRGQAKEGPAGGAARTENETTEEG
jgi:hypothetical protein